MEEGKDETVSFEAGSNLSDGASSVGNGPTLPSPESNPTIARPVQSNSSTTRDVIHMLLFVFSAVGGFVTKGAWDTTIDTQYESTKIEAAVKLPIFYENSPAPSTWPTKEEMPVFDTNYWARQSANKEANKKAYFDAFYNLLNEHVQKFSQSIYIRTKLKELRIVLDTTKSTNTKIYV